MPTNITSASEITKRANNKAIANNFINRIQRANILGYGTPTGIYDSSIINDVITGNMTTYTKCDTGYNINYGCECSSSANNINSSPQPPIPPSSGGNATYFGLPEGGPVVTSVSLANGSEIVMGTFSGTIDLFDLNNVTPSPIRMSLTSPYGGICTYIAKYDASGILLGATKICSSFGNTSGFSICSDLTSLYITGQTVGTTDFYQASTSDPNDVLNSISRPDGNTTTPYMFIANYDLILNSVVWTIPSTANLGFSIAVSGNYLAVTGNFIQTANFYDTGLYPPSGSPYASFNIAPDPNLQTFLIVYNISGVAQWVTYGLGASTSLYTSVIFDDDNNPNNLYLTGSVSGSLRLYHANNLTPSTPSLSFTMTGSVGIDSIIAKYNINGQVQWGTKLVSNRNERGLSISYYNGNIYATGQYAQTLNIYNATGTSNPTTVAYNLSSVQLSTHAYIVKFDSNGQLKWANKIDDGPTAPSGFASGSSIVSNTSGVYITGSIQGTIQVYNPSIISSTLSITPPILNSTLLSTSGLNTRSASSTTYYRLKDNNGNEIPIIDLVTGDIIPNSYVEARLNSNNQYIDAFDNIIINISDSTTNSNILLNTVTSIPFNFVTNNGVNTLRSLLVAKYDLDGNLQWITYVGNPNTGLSPIINTQGSDIIINGSQLWVCGQIVGSVNIYEGNGINPPDTISPPPIAFDFTPSDTNQRGILIKYDLDGQILLSP